MYVQAEAAAVGMPCSFLGPLFLECFEIKYMTLPHHGKFKYATQPPGPSLKGWATSVPNMVKWAYLGRPLTDLAEIKNPGFKFHPGHFELGWARLGPK